MSKRCVWSDCYIQRCTPRSGCSTHREVGGGGEGAEWYSHARKLHLVRLIEIILESIDFHFQKMPHNARIRLLDVVKLIRNRWSGVLDGRVGRIQKQLCLDNSSNVIPLPRQSPKSDLSVIEQRYGSASANRMRDILWTDNLLNKKKWDYGTARLMGNTLIDLRWIRRFETNRKIEIYLDINFEPSGGRDGVPWSCGVTVVIALPDEAVCKYNRTVLTVVNVYAGARQSDNIMLHSSCFHFCRDLNLSFS